MGSSRGLAFSLVAPGLILGLALGCSASETDNSGERPTVGGSSATGSGGGGVSTGGTSSAASPSDRGGAAARGSAPPSGASGANTPCTLNTSCTADCTNASGQICRCRRGLLASCE